MSKSRIWRFYKKCPRHIRKLIEKTIIKIDGGEYFSSKLRYLYSRTYNIEIGIGSYGCFDILQFPEGTHIGNYCSIAPRVHYLFSNHPMDGVSTSPVFYNKNLGFVKEDRITRYNLIIGHDVWIGADVTITCGCKQIGTGAVIGAGSVVTHDVPSFAVVAGNPARIIRQRVTEDIRIALEESEWYLLPPKTLEPLIDYAEDPLLFCSKVKLLKQAD